MICTEKPGHYMEKMSIKVSGTNLKSLGKMAVSGKQAFRCIAAYIEQITDLGI